MAESRIYVVADGERARLYRRREERPGYDMIEEIASPVAGKPSRALLTERPGRSFDSMGGQRHAMEPRTNPKTDAKHAFMRDIAKQLGGMVKKGGAAELVLVAPPRMLATLRDSLDARSGKAVRATLGKDLSKLPARELYAALGAIRIRKPLG